MEITNEQYTRLQQMALDGARDCLEMIKKQLEEWEQKKGERIYCAFNKKLNNYVADQKVCEFGAWPNVDYAAIMTLYGAEVTSSVVVPSEGYFQPMLVKDALKYQIRYYENKIKEYGNDS